MKADKNIDFSTIDWAFVPEKKGNLFTMRQ